MNAHHFFHTVPHCLRQTSHHRSRIRGSVCRQLLNWNQRTPPAVRRFFQNSDGSDTPHLQIGTDYTAVGSVEYDDDTYPPSSFFPVTKNHRRASILRPARTWDRRLPPPHPPSEPPNLDDGPRQGATHPGSGAPCPFERSTAGPAQNPRVRLPRPHTIHGTCGCERGPAPARHPRPSVHSSAPFFASAECSSTSVSQLTTGGGSARSRSSARSMRDSA